MARGLMAKEKEGQTLQPTAVVHEVYIRLLAGSSPSWNSRAHFFGAAAQAMRRLLIDQARRKARLKRGGDRERVTLEEDALFCEPRPEALLALDAALTRLEDLDPKMAKVVNLRYYAGLTIQETAQALETSPSSVTRLWTAARAWLQKELTTAGHASAA